MTDVRGEQLAEALPIVLFKDAKGAKDASVIKGEVCKLVQVRDARQAMIFRLPWALAASGDVVAFGEGDKLQRVEGRSNSPEGVVEGFSGTGEQVAVFVNGAGLEVYKQGLELGAGEDNGCEARFLKVATVKA